MTANHRDFSEIPPPDFYGLPDHDCWVYRAKAPVNLRGVPPVVETIVVSASSRTELRFESLAHAVVLEEAGHRVLSMDEGDCRSRGMGWERPVRFVRRSPEVVGEWYRHAEGATVVDLASWLPAGEGAEREFGSWARHEGRVEAPSFRELTRDDYPSLVYSVTVALSVALSGSWAEEAARNFVQGLSDGRVRDVFRFAVDVLNSSTRRHARKGGAELARLAAARATAAYVDHVTGPQPELQRWGMLVGVGVPVALLRDAELRAALVVEERCA